MGKRGPASVWSMEKIGKAFAEFVEKNERLPAAREMKPQYGLPTRRTFERYMGMTAQEYAELRYEDYLSTPNRGNASAFITMAIEQNLSQLIRREKYLEYIAKRPRAQRFGAHGLFTGDKDSLVLSQTAKAVAEHPGNVWLPIISLRREDAARLGYDNAENWKSFLSSYAMQMATAMKIPWEQFRWYAAFHNESHHPHIHMVCYSADPAKGFLTKTGIAQIKSGLAKHIFRQELTELYQKQTKSRNALNEDARSVLEQLIEQMRSGTAVNHRMEKLMEHLAERLRHTGGKKQYGYLKAPLKAVVDEIVDELAKDPCVAAAYALWHELREDVLRTYRDDLPPRLPLSQQKEFKRIKNIVIEEAVKLGARQQVFHPDDQQDGVSAATPGDPSLPELTQPDDDCGDPVESPPEAPPEKSGSAKAHMEWSKEYRLARRCLFGDKNQPQDFEQAFSLFQEEAQKGNALAMCDLGRMLADGLGQEIDIQAAQLWRNRRKTAMRSTGSANSMPRASAVSRTMVMPPGGSNFPQTKGTSMRNIPLLACFAVGRVWSRTMRGRWSYTQPPHSSTSPMLPTS